MPGLSVQHVEKQVCIKIPAVDEKDCVLLHASIVPTGDRLSLTECSPPKVYCGIPCLQHCIPPNPWAY